MPTPKSTVTAERLLQLFYKRTQVVLDAFRQLKIPQTRPLEIELAMICKESEKIIKNGVYLDHYKYDPEWEIRFIKRKFAELKAKKEKAQKKPEPAKISESKSVAPDPVKKPPKEETKHFVVPNPDKVPLKSEPKPTEEPKDPVFQDIGNGKVKVEYSNGTYKIVSQKTAEVMKRNLERPKTAAPHIGTPVMVKPVKKSSKIAPPNA